jgi:hypothetical protein
LLVDDVRDVAGCRCVPSWTSWFLVGGIWPGRIIGLVVRWLYSAVVVIGHVECTGGSGSEVGLVWRVVEVESSEAGGEGVKV